jgi:hypothetical protein
MGDKKEKSSLLSASVAASPLGVGIGVAARNALQSGAHVTSKTSSMMGSIGEFTASSMPRVPTSGEIHNFMRRGIVGQPVRGDVARQAWEWAMMGIDPSTREGLLHYTRNINKMSGTEAIRAIGMTVDTNKSAIMGNIWRRFQTNAEMIEEQRNLHGVVPSYQSIMAGRVTMPYQGDIPSEIGQGFQRIAKSLGGARYKVAGITRPELAGSNFAMFHTTFRTGIGDLNISIPSIQAGSYFEGGTLQTKRIAPDVLVVGQTGVRRFNRSAFFLKEVEESIIPDIGVRLKSSRDLNKAIKQLHTNVFGELEAVPAVAPGKRTAAQAQYETIRGQTIDVRMREKARRLYSSSPEFMSVFRKPTDKELSELMTSETGRSLNLGGGVGPKAMSEGRLSTKAWDKLDITGGPVEWGRRPEQAYRRFQLTQQATQYMRSHERMGKYKAYEVAAQRLSESNALGPSVKALYVNPESRAFAAGGKAEILERLAIGEGETAMRANLAKNLQFESLETIKLTNLRSDLLEQGFDKLLPGEIIGTTERGIPFTFKKGMNITGLERFDSPGMGEFARMSYIQEHKFVHGSKVFGGAKAVTLLRQDDEFSKAARNLNRQSTGIDIIANMDELKKNKALHRRQMLTALSDFVSENMYQGDKQALKALRNRDIQSLGKGFVKSATQAGTYDHSAFIKNLMTFAAKESGITAQQFGSVFGAVPHVLGEEEASQILSKTLLPHMSLEDYSLTRKHFFSGTATGITSLSFGGPAIDVGGLGSLEPRAFEILGQPQFGATGQSLSKEFLSRMEHTSPEVLKTHRELGRTLGSFVGDISGPKPKTAFLASQGYDANRIQGMMDEGAFLIRPGKGQRDIYVPSAQALSDEALGGLRGFETGSGKLTRGHIGQMYHDMAYNASQFAQGEIDVDTYQQKMTQTAESLRKEWAPFGKGSGSVARGKMMGSTFLRGMSATKLGAKTAIREATSIGISQAAFDRMASDMGRMGYDVLKMKTAFEEGKKVGGMIWRHPQIGGYSMQYANLQLAPGAGPTDVVLPEIGANIQAQVGEEVVEKRITLGPLVGLAGDKDADAYAIALVSPDREKEIRTMLSTADNEFTQRYTQHQVRMQLFKAKAASDDGLTTIRKMAGDVEKLAAGQRWVGPLSVQLSTAKESLSTAGRGAAAADARALLEWLEQTPISAKHMSAEEAAGGGLSSMMESITSALETRNETRLKETVRSIVASDALSTEMLTKNVTLTSGADEISRIMNSNFDKNIKGIDIDSATKELMRTMSNHHANGGMRAYERLAGKGSRIKLTEIPEMLAKGAGYSEMLSQGTISKVARAFTASTNALGQVGRSIIKNHKTIGLGFAGSLALASVMSSPKETIGPGRGLVPNAKMNMGRGKAANRMSPEAIHPGGQSVGSPTPPNMLRSGQARIATGSPGRRVQVRAQAESFTNIESIIGQTTGLGAGSNVNLIDNRSSLLPHEIANKVL